jgi:histidine triad (HIT) family protein
VFHLHFHILPMKEGVGLKPHSGKMADHAVLAQGVAAIREALET